MRSGAGIKMKASIPLWNGLAVIATPEGANGLSNSATLSVANNPKVFADQMRTLQTQRGKSNSMPPRAEIYMENQTQDLERWLESLTFGVNSG
jgi:hypothetical protein